MEPTEVDALVTVADQFYREGNLQEAKASYQQVIVADPERAWAHSRLGAILAQQSEFDEAEKALTRALEIDPLLPQAHSNLGNIYYAKGDYEKALAKYKEAVALSPDSPVYRENLHAAYKKLGKLSDAVAALKKAHRLNQEATRSEAKSKLDEMKRGLKARTGCFTLTAIGLLLAGLLAVVLH